MNWNEVHESCSPCRRRSASFSYHQFLPILSSTGASLKHGEPGLTGAAFGSTSGASVRVRNAESEPNASVGGLSLSNVAAFAVYKNERASELRFERCGRTKTSENYPHAIDYRIPLRSSPFPFYSFSLVSSRLDCSARRSQPRSTPRRVRAWSSLAGRRRPSLAGHLIQGSAAFGFGFQFKLLLYPLGLGYRGG